MYHPAVIAQVAYRVREQQMRLADACQDAGQFFGLNAVSLTEACRRLGRL